MSRKSGILLHISSLPGPDGIGSMGKEAYAFADFLAEAGMHIWQVLPLGPTGYGESPYQSASVFAGNPMLISLEKLKEDGLLRPVPREEEWVEPSNAAQVDFEAMKAHKLAMLRDSFFQSEDRLQKEISAFRREQPWVNDFALFQALKKRFGNMMWTQWPDRAIRRRDPSAIARCKTELSDEVHFQIYCQYLFQRQWMELKKYCNSKGIEIFGDMPIYVAEDSADTWTHPEVFQLDRDGVPRRVAGVPPDLFSATGQLWGNPLYRWHRLRWRGYGWWVERMRRMKEMYDIIRIDHFIGFANYYSIPHGAATAQTGKWVVGPGKHLFDTFKKKLPDLNIVAEDLGVVNDRVRALLNYVGYPGMKVLTFGFGGGEDNPHRLTNFTQNSVAYTGTHDNDTVLGFLSAADAATVEDARRLLGFKALSEAPEAFCRAVMNSKSDTAVLSMQDVLGLDGTARMNFPSTIGGNNWKWRMLPGAADAALARRLRQWNQEAER